MPVVLCGLFAALGSVTFGYDLGIIASVLVSDNEHVHGMGGSCARLSCRL